TASSRCRTAAKSASTSIAAPTRCTSWCAIRFLQTPRRTRATTSRSPTSANACCCTSTSTPSSSWNRWVPFIRCTSSSPTPMNAPNPPLRVLIVDDEAPARHRLRDVLVDCADQLPVDIVGEAENGLDALNQAQQRPVDAVLL